MSHVWEMAMDFDYDPPVIFPEPEFPRSRGQYKSMSHDGKLGFWIFCVAALLCGLIGLAIYKGWFL